MTLTKKQLDYITEWAESGNEPRKFAEIPQQLDGTFQFDLGSSVVLCPIGLTIAQLARENAKLRASALETCDGKSAAYWCGRATELDRAFEQLWTDFEQLAARSK